MDMSLVVRPCDAADREGLFHVWSMTYNGGKPYDPGEQVFKHSDGFVAELDGKIVGGFGVMPMTATRGPAILNSAGVLAVAVLPYVRQTGVGKEMMRAVLRIYRDRGYELAALYAFRESYYRGVGYEVAGARYKIQVEAARLPRFNMSLPGRERGMDSVDAIRDCYKTFAHRRSGLNLRGHKQWDRILNPDSHRTLYTVGEPVEAYAVVQHSPDFWADQRIEELVWTTRRGYESILAVMSGIAINKSKLEWFEPTDSPYRAAYQSLGGKVVALEPQTMFRVVNVAKALEGLKPTSTGEFTIEVIDDTLPENQGPWRVAFSPEGVEVTRTDEADLSIDVRQFAQAFLGEPSLQELLINDLVIVREPYAIASATSLLTPSNTVCLEFF